MSSVSCALARHFGSASSALVPVPKATSLLVKVIIVLMQSVQSFTPSINSSSFRLLVAASVSVTSIL